MSQFSVKKICQGILWLFIVAVFFSCKSKKSNDPADDVVTSWIGKTIKFPKNAQCSVLGEYTPCKFSVVKPYKILLYTDSTGCTSCKLRIDEWKNLIKEADTTMHGKVDFFFYFYPKNDGFIYDLMKRENFRDQVYIDNRDELNRLNNLPKTMDYQCFLLDRNNKVLLVGNPTFNSNVWKVEKDIISGKIKMNMN